jgi:hypothetical protein
MATGETSYERTVDEHLSEYGNEIRDLTALFQTLQGKLMISYYAGRKDRWYDCMLLLRPSRRRMHLVGCRCNILLLPILESLRSCSLVLLPRRSRRFRFFCLHDHDACRVLHDRFRWLLCCFSRRGMEMVQQPASPRITDRIDGIQIEDRST